MKGCMDKGKMKKLATLSKKEEKIEAEMNRAVHRNPKKSVRKKGK